MTLLVMKMTSHRLSRNVDSFGLECGGDRQNCIDVIMCSCVAVENESHCDFVKLREMLIRVNMEDLREQTHARHYELYRRCKLEEMGFKDTDPDSQPFRWVTAGETRHMITGSLKVSCHPRHVMTEQALTNTFVQFGVTLLQQVTCDQKC